jgi:L-ascorbate metabolism protein UlaG (beta-lactamase superfamily)
MSMERREFLKSGAGLGLAIAVGAEPARAAQSKDVRVQLIRHATLIVHYGGRVLLVDPMFGDPGVMPPITNSPNPRPNPLVPLPMPAEKVLAGIDAVLVTHTHPDHWDAAAVKLVPKDAPLFIQPPDAKRMAEQGFTTAQPIEASTTWNGITIARTGGQHGRGEVGKRLAPVSGFVLKVTGAPTIYIAGDTVWCPEVESALSAHKPDIVILNAGAAQFLEGGPITMDAADVLQVRQAAPKARVIAVHMEAINHCVLTRAALRAEVGSSPQAPTVSIPADGEVLTLS